MIFIENGYKCESFTSKHCPLFFLLKHTPPAPSVEAEELARWPRCCGVRNKIYPLGYTWDPLTMLPRPAPSRPIDYSHPEAESVSSVSCDCHLYCFPFPCALFQTCTFFSSGLRALDCSVRRDGIQYTTSTCYSADSEQTE